MAGTRFRTLLAPVGVSTGDGRRFARDAVGLDNMPLPFEWVRSREGGHTGAVSVGSVTEAHVGTVADALDNGWIGPEAIAGMNPAMVGIWGLGRMYDDVSRDELPRLAQDVVEAMFLIGKGTLGPSVDLDSFEGVPVLAGTDTPVTFEVMEAFEQGGTEPDIELLITSARVRAATLVSIPAFAETSRPLELLPASDEADESAESGMALIASLGAAVALPSAALFTGELTGPTLITYDFEAGRVFGHIATWQTCHAGIPDVCFTPPRDASGAFAGFNRFLIETDAGPVWAGRLTAGGRHAGLSLAADATMREYDKKATVAYVRAYADEFGIAVAGVLEPGLSEGDRAILSRRKVSGDWRETREGLSLVEVLALSPGPRSDSEPGFPVETFSRAGRQVSLVASFGPDADRMVTPAPVDTAALAVAVVDEINRRAARDEAMVTLTALVKVGTEKERAVLVATLSREA